MLGVAPAELVEVHAVHDLDAVAARRSCQLPHGGEELRVGDPGAGAHVAGPVAEHEGRVVAEALLVRPRRGRDRLRVDGVVELRGQPVRLQQLADLLAEAGQAAEAQRREQAEPDGLAVAVARVAR